MHLMTTTGILINHTFQAYDDLFDMIEKTMRSVNRSKTGRGPAAKHQADQILSGLKAASEKLSKYYQRTDAQHTYFAARLLHPCFKDRLFKKPSWNKPPGEESYCDEYTRRLNDMYIAKYLTLDGCNKTPPNVHEVSGMSQASDYSQTPSSLGK